MLNIELLLGDRILLVYLVEEFNFSVENWLRLEVRERMGLMLQGTDSIKRGTSLRRLTGMPGVIGFRTLRIKFFVEASSELGLLFRGLESRLNWRVVYGPT